MQPMQTTLFWINYVAATKGAPHLQSSATGYSTFVFYNLDVWMFFIVVLAILTFFVWKNLPNIKYCLDPSEYIK